MAPTARPAALTTQIPRESYRRLFLRFLRFGTFAWGGPVAQIAMIRQQLVEEERWIGPEHFNRLLALYQVLPGPEAHELCVYFGMLARGRWGGVVAGLGFMLPGFVLMLLLSWAYVRFGLGLPGIAAVLAAAQAAVAALIVRAVVRIGGHVVVDRWTWLIAILAGCAQVAGVHFAITLLFGGLVYLLARMQRARFAYALVAAAVIALIGWVVRYGWGAVVIAPGSHAIATAIGSISVAALFWSGLKAGLLTFGGAYTAIPLLQRDVVVHGGWMSNAQFLDGLALSGLLPAPLIIFATFIGYLGAGFAGAFAITAGVFIPAFAFTLLGHDALERLIDRPRVKYFLDGVTAGVVGIIAGASIGLIRAGVQSLEMAILFVLALLIFFRSKARLTIPAVIAGAALWGAASAWLR